MRESGHIHLDFCEHRAAADRNHEVGNSCGSKFDGQRGRQVAGLQAERGRESGARKWRAGEARGALRHGDTHGAAVVKSEFDGKNSGAGLLQDVHAALRGGNDAKFGQQKPRADDGMAGERELAGGGENAQTSERAIIRGPLDENGFRKIHLARDGLHFRGGNAVAVGDDRERVAGETFGGEDIERVESAIHAVPLSGAARRLARTVDDSAFCGYPPEITGAVAGRVEQRFGDGRSGD